MANYLGSDIDEDHRIGAEPEHRKICRLEVSTRDLEIIFEGAKQATAGQLNGNSTTPERREASPVEIKKPIFRLSLPNLISEKIEAAVSAGKTPHKEEIALAAAAIGHSRQKARNEFDKQRPGARRGRPRENNSPK